MFVEDFSFSKDDNGVEYVTYEENPTKTRQGGLRKKRRVIQPKMFATDGPRCPVKLLKTFLSHRPEEMKRSGPFYLAVIERPKSQVWYKRQRIGIHSINSFMKSMAAQAEIEGKKLTNHSARKTLAKKLKAPNQPRSAIIGVTTGHTNERRRWKRATADFLNHKLRRSGKHIQPSKPSTWKYWPFLYHGKHADDERRADDDCQQLSRLSSHH